MSHDGGDDILDFSFLAWLKSPSPGMSPKRVQLKRHRGTVVNPYDIYIGRHCHCGGWKLPTSKWNRPRRCRTSKLYRDHVMRSPDLMEDLKELMGKRLGCFCEPGATCHGDVLIELCKEKNKLQKE